MAKVTQRDAGKQKISLAPVKALSSIPSEPDAIAPKVVARAATPAPVAAAPAAPLAPAAKETPPAAPAPKPVAAETLATKPVTAAPVAATPAKPVATAKPVAAPKLVKAAAAIPVARRPQSQPASVFSLSAVPLHPGLTDFTAETWFAPAIATVRRLALMNARVLDHACAELQATLAEVEALSRASSPSEAVAVQGKAFSRRIEAGSACVADLASLARRTDKAA